MELPAEAADLLCVGWGLRPDWERLVSLGCPQACSPSLRREWAHSLCWPCSQWHSLGGSLGELNHAIVVDQFNRLREGDSWWYERYGILDDASLQEVQNTKFVRGNYVPWQYSVVVEQREPMVPLLHCDHVPTCPGLRTSADVSRAVSKT